MKINFYGAPCTGKSTAAAKTFAAMKQRGCNVDYVVEYVKLMTYKQTKLTKYEQLWLVAQQLLDESTKIGAGVDIICESPSLMACFYLQYMGLECDSLIDVVMELERTVQTKNVFLTSSGVPYQQIGRLHSEEEASRIEQEMRRFLERLGIHLIITSAKEYDMRMVL